MNSIKECEKCGDTGWLILEREGLSGAERCSCFGLRTTNQRQRTAGIPPKFSGVTLENFDKNHPAAQGALSQVWLAVRQYAKEFPLTKKPGLMLVGGTGTGKTHLAVAALKMLMSRGFDGRFVEYQELIERIQQGWSAEAGESDKSAYRQVLDAEILLLDDLGAQRSLDWVQDTITSVITHRYNHNKPMIVTTNLPDPIVGPLPRLVKSLAEVVGERSRSLLLEMCSWVPMPPIEDRRERLR
jgi:DNA replication protein DnaC